MRTHWMMISIVLMACAAQEDAGDGDSSSTTPADDSSTTAPAETSSESAPDDDGTTDVAETSSDDGASGSSSSSATSDADSTDTGAAPSPECILYCDEFIPNCSAIPNVEVYDDLDDCLQTCAPWPHGPVGEFSGPTVECRIAHLTFDPEPGPGYYELHCFHAQEHPSSECV